MAEIDAMTLPANLSVVCLDSGHLRLVDCMPRLLPEGQTGDYAVAQMARVSYGAGTKTVNEDRGLIRYLMRHQHWTPFEGVEFKFHAKCPLFVARQWFRHRTAKINEISGRYSEVRDEFYFPDPSNVRVQSKENKQGGSSVADLSVADDFVASSKELCKDAYALYKSFLEDEVSREQARMLLPVNLYTEFYWKCDLRNILHFMSLRADSHAQQEIRVFADAMIELVRPIVPWTVEAWDDYHPLRGAVMLSRLEADALRKIIPPGSVFQDIDSTNKREKIEWAEKYSKLIGTKE